MQLSGQMMLGTSRLDDGRQTLDTAVSNLDYEMRSRILLHSEETTPANIDNVPVAVLVNANWVEFARCGRHSKSMAAVVSVKLARGIKPKVDHGL